MPDNRESLVRDAEASDAERIARVHVDAWRETYSGIVDERFFSEDAFDRRKSMWSRYLSSPLRTGSLVVAERGGEIVGFANAGPAVGPDAEHGFTPVRPEHLFSIYVLSAAQRGGLGHRMLDAVLEDRPAQLWVLRGNAQAIGFYERTGSGRTASSSSIRRILGSWRFGWCADAAAHGKTDCPGRRATGSRR